MNMKTTFVTAIMVLLLSMMVSAQVMPWPVDGQITIGGVPAADGSITVTNLGTDEVLLVDIKEDGYYKFDMSEFKQGVLIAERGRVGDVLNFKVCSGSPKCVAEVPLINKQPLLNQDFNFLSSDVTEGLTREVIVEVPVEVIVEKEVVKEVIVKEEIFVEVPAKYEFLGFMELSPTQLTYLLSGGGLGLVGLLALAGYYWRKGQKDRATKMVKTYLKNKKVK